jgi:hypothetical protein
MKQKEVVKRICAYCKRSVIFNREQTGYYVPDQMKIVCSDECLDRLIWETMIAMGWLFPTAPEAVEIAERAMKDDPIPPLPDGLKVPPDLPQS